MTKKVPLLISQFPVPWSYPGRMPSALLQVLYRFPKNKEAEVHLLHVHKLTELANRQNDSIRCLSSYELKKDKGCKFLATYERVKKLSRPRLTLS
jgi:hypothetical protein